MASKHMFRNCSKKFRQISTKKHWITAILKITIVDTYEEFKEKIEEGGFILAHWDGTTETEEKIKEDTKATIRCIPFESYIAGDKEPGKCMVTGKPSACRVVFARSY